MTGRGRGRGQSSLVPKNSSPKKSAATNNENRPLLSIHGRDIPNDRQIVEPNGSTSASSNTLSAPFDSALSQLRLDDAGENAAVSQDVTNRVGRVGRGRGRPPKSSSPSEQPHVGGLAEDVQAQVAPNPVHLRLQMQEREPPGAPGSSSVSGSVCGDDCCHNASGSVSIDSGFVPVSISWLILHFAAQALDKDRSYLLLNELHNR